MKKIILSALMLITITATAFSRTNTSINDHVLASFNKSFTRAQEVKWEEQKNFVKVTFILDGQTMFAYYKPNGDQIAVTRNVPASQLPINLAVELKSKLNDSWITELFEVSSDGTTAYYATIESPAHVTTFKADASGTWTTLRKEKKDGQ